MALVRRILPCLLVIAGLLGLTGRPSAAAIDPQWTRLIGTAEDDRSNAVEVAGSAVYVGGEVRAALPGQVHSGEDDAVLRRYNRAGDLVWTRQFGTSSGDSIRGVAATSDVVYVVGFTHGTLPGRTSAGLGDAFLRKYGANGELRWTSQFGTGGYDVASTVELLDGAIYVGGDVGGALPGKTSSGSTDVFLRRYQPDGDLVWTRQFGSSGYDSLGGMDVRGTSIHLAGVVGAALPGKTSAGGNDAFIRTYRAGGVVERTWQFGTSDWDAAAGVDADPLGLVVAGGTYGDLAKSSAGDGDGFVRRYRPNGTIRWTRQFGTSADEDIDAVQASGGRVIVGGGTGGAFPGKTSAGKRDAFLRGFESDGTIAWTHQFGTAENESVDALDLPASGIYVAGTTGAGLGGEGFNGIVDGFVQRLTP